MYHHHITLALAAIVAMAPAGAFAQPTHDLATPASERANAAPSAALGSITFTNPLDGSRGPGAGAGLL